MGDVASKRPRRSRFRRILLAGIAAFVVLAVAAWVFRNQVLAPLVRPYLTEALRSALGADHVTVGAIEGSWIHGAIVHDVNVSSSRPPVRMVRNMRVSATWDPFALLRGDLGGLRSLHASADAAELDLRDLAGPREENETATPPTAVFERILAVAIDGATVTVGDLHLHTTFGERRGPLRLTIGPGGAERHVELTYASDLHVATDVAAADGERVSLHDTVIAVPGAALAVPILVLPDPWTRPGSFAQVATAEFTLDVKDLAPYADLLPPVLRERLPAQATIRGSIGEGWLHLATSEVHVRGLELELAEGSLPLASDDWRSADAAIRFTARLDGFTADVPALGASVFRGEIAGQVDGPLASPGASVELRLGRCESELGSFETANGTLRIDARGLTDPTLHIEGLIARDSAGAPVTVTCKAEGSLPLTADAAVTAPAGTFVLHVAARRPADPDGTPALDVQATLRADERSLRCEDVAFVAGPARLHGGATLGRGMAALLAGDVVDAPLQVNLELAEFDVGAMPPRWIGDTRLAGRVTGTVLANGTVRQPQPDVQLVWHDAHVRIPDLPALHDGEVRIALTTNGDTASSLQVDGTGIVDLPAGMAPLSIAALLHCGEDGTRLSVARVGVGDASITADLGSDLRRSQLLGGADLRHASVSGSVRAQNLSLASLPEDLLGLGPLVGFVDADATIRGDLGHFGPAAIERAHVVLRDGNVRFGDGARLERLALELDVTPQALELVSLAGTMGAGAVTASGSLRTDATSLIDGFDAAVIDLQVRGNDALLYRSSGANVRADADLTVTGTPAAMEVKGEVALGRGSKYVHRLSVLPDLHSRGGAPAGLGLRLPTIPPPVGPRLHFDVAVRSESPFEARTHLFDGDLDIAARLLGTGNAPRFEGTVAVSAGKLRFPGASLRVTGGQLTFTRTDPLFPMLQLTAEGKRMGVVVTMIVRGPYDRPEVTLSSLPPLPTQDLVLLLTTGQLPSTMMTRGPYGQARVVGEYLATEAWGSLFGSDSTELGDSVLDRVTIETGREVSRNGIESLSVEYELVPDVGLRAERDRYEDFNLGIVLRIRLP